MSDGELSHPNYSELLSDDKIYHVSKWTFFVKDGTHYHGEITYRIGLEDADNFARNKLYFSYGDGESEFSKVEISIPKDITFLRQFELDNSFHDTMVTFIQPAIDITLRRYLWIYRLCLMKSPMMIYRSFNFLN